jgi:hypothetical protein
VVLSGDDGSVMMLTRVVAVEVVNTFLLLVCCIHALIECYILTLLYYIYEHCNLDTITLVKYLGYT